MSDPITDFELGKMLHREYETEASRYWGQHLAQQDKLGRSKGRKLALASRWSCWSNCCRFSELPPAGEGGIRKY